MLLFWPCSWGLAYGFKENENLNLLIYYLLLFFMGSVLMRSAGCIFNDIVDKDFDAKVKQAGAIAKANINPEVLDMTLSNGTRLGDHPEIIKGFAKIASMMSEDKMVTTESESVSSVSDIETEISSITNDINGPYWNKSHPDHDKVVQQVYTLREMLNDGK